MVQLVNLMERARRETGKGMRASVAWGGRHIARSLSASTLPGKKLRPVIRNPDSRYKTDHRVAPFGVWNYYQSRPRKFRPIYRTGEFGKIRFFDKRSFSWFERDRFGGRWRSLPSGPDVANPEIVAPGIMNDKRRKIGRAGMAKRAWRIAAQQIGARGNSVVNLMGVDKVASIRWSDLNRNPTLRITNHLKYASLAFRAKGAHAITSAGERAAQSMKYVLEKQLGSMAR